MPCVNSNGQPVPGAQGMCPIGSTWREPTGWFGQDRMSEEDIQLNWESMANRKPLMDRPDWMPDWGVDAGIIAAGVLGGGRNPGSKKALWQSMKNMGTRLKDKGESVVNKVRGGGQPDLFGGPRILDRLKAIGIPSFSKFKELYGSVSGKKKLIALGITAPIATMIYQNSSQIFGGDEKKEESLSSGPPTRNSRAKALSSKDAQFGSRFGMETEVSDWQQLKHNMSDPDYWKKSISGLPHDTRLMRIGQLMDYYGRTPKQRAAVDMPSKVWAENEAAAAKIKADMLASQAKKPTSVLAKMGDDELDAAVRPRVMEKLGFSDWIPGNQPSDASVEQDVAMVKTLVQQYHTVDGMPIEEAIKKALTKVTNTNIPILPIF